MVKRSLAIMFSTSGLMPLSSKSSCARAAMPSGVNRVSWFWITATDVNGWYSSTASPYTPNTLPLMVPAASLHR